jgi:hypothetical protein
VKILEQQPSTEDSSVLSEEVFGFGWDLYVVPTIRFERWQYCDKHEHLDLMFYLRFILVSEVKPELRLHAMDLLLLIALCATCLKPNLIKNCFGWQIMFGMIRRIGKWT